MVSTPRAEPAAGDTLYGNMLRPEDGLRGWNFLTEAIHMAAEQRIGEAAGVVEKQRLRNNLLSSQPLCFNVFAPLAADLALATDLLRTLPGVPSDIQALQVLFEHAPPKPAHLDDNSAFDAFIVYQRPGGIRGFLGIETKLTEPFSQQTYPFGARYRRWQAQPTWWWRAGAELWFREKLYNQLWRNHLLAFSMLHQPESAFSEGYCVVLYPEGDAACTQAIEAYRTHLEPNGSAMLLVLCLADVAEWWLQVATRRADLARLKALRLRYVDLEASQPARQRL